MTDFLVAEAAIRQLYARYADSVWRKDAEAFGDCLAEDVEWRISGQVFNGRDTAKAVISNVFPKFSWCSVNFKTPIVNLTGKGTATARTFFHEQSVFTHGRTWTALGTYFDRCFEDTDGQWRFKWRLFQTHYSGSPDLSGPRYPQEDFGPPPNMPPLDATTVNHTPGVVAD